MKKLVHRSAIMLGIFILSATRLQSQIFSEQTSVTLPGVSNGSLSWGDFDNDGDLDLLISGIESDNTTLLKVFRNTTGAFTDAGIVFPDATPGYGVNFTAVWADLNNDNYLDIIASGPASSYGSSEIVIYKNNGNSTFTEMYTSSYLTFQGGSSFDCGDFDNDGDIDILLSGSTETKILKNKGSFVFADVPVPLPALQYSSSKWVDIDNDGDLDIILSGQQNYDSKIRIYQNQGNDLFVRIQELYGSGAIDAGDYNNDGFTDILTSNHVFKNNGTGIFESQSGISLPYLNHASCKWGDFDNDGDNDIILTGSNLTKVYLNNGNNSFSELTGANLAGISDGYASPGDYDGDGDLDIVLCGITGSSKICKLYRNGSTIVNQSPDAPTGLTYSTSGNDVILTWNKAKDNTDAALSYNLVVGNTSGAYNIVNPAASVSNGYLRRAVMGNGQQGTTFLLRNLPKGTYSWKVQAVDNSFRGGAFSVESTFNYNSSVQSYGLNVAEKGGTKCTLEWSRGNGGNCIVFMKEGSTGTSTFTPADGSNYTASSVMGSSAGTWYCIYKGISNSVTVTNLKARTDYSFQVFEFDAGPVYNVQSIPNNPYAFTTNTFTDTGINLQPITTYSIGGSTVSSTYWFDSDNDNDLDLLLLGSGSAYLYRNDGANVFTQMIPGLPGGYSASLGDYDNDGYTDLVITGNNGVYRNNGNNTFTLQPFTLPNLYSAPVAWNDYDNDGHLDFVISGELSSEGKKTLVYKGKGDGTFTLQELIMLDQVGYGAIKWGDFDNDGFNDLAISGSDNAAVEMTTLYKNDHKGNFLKLGNTGFTGGTTSTIDWGDYDLDGDLDLLVGDFNSTKLYRNDGNGTFTEQTGINLRQSGYGSVAWGDYDNDGDPDILIAGFSLLYQPFTTIYRNNGDNTFTEDLNCVLPGSGFGSASWGDYDNDGDLDIIITGNDADKAFSKIFRNDIVTANIKPAAPQSPSSTVDKSDVTLSWKSVRSDATPYKSITYNIKVGTASGGINVVSPHSNPVTGYRKVATPGNAGPDTVFYLRNLPFATYYWSVQAVDNDFAGSVFSSQGTFQVVPVQASKLSASIIDKNSLLLKWERGNGDRCAVFCKQASSGNAVPVNSTGYIADGEFGFGTQIGASGWYCVYNGRADSAVIKGLVYEKEYSFHVIEFTGLSGSETYFTNVVDGNPGVFTTSLFAKQTGIVLPYAMDNPPAWGDYDNDGFIDLLLPGNPTKIYRNNGNNTFSDIGLTLPSVYHGSASWGDYDNDNDLDFIISGATVEYPAASPITKLYRNDGSGTFTEVATTFQAVYYGSTEWYDYNGDGYLDMLLTGATGTDPSFNPVSKLYKNNGNGTFTAQAVTLTGVYKGTAKWGDYDNDGDPDIILGGVLDYDENHNTMKIYRNDGSNIFTVQAVSGLQSVPKVSISWGDYDNDGDLDVLMSNYWGMTVFRNNGNNQFLSVYSASYGYRDAAGTAWWDYDNDGFLDIISTRPGLNTEIYRNITNTGSQQPFIRQDDEALSNVGYRYVAIADYDNDGDNDFILTNSNGGGGVSLVIRNNLIMKSGLFSPNTAPSAVTGIAATYSPRGIVLKWNPATDDMTPSKTMMYNVRIGSSPGSENITPSNSNSAGFRRIPVTGNSFTDTTFLLKNMPSGTYYWKVQATDQDYKGGAWSAEGTFEARNVQAFFSATEVCNGKPTIFTDQSVATSGITARKWYFADGTISTSTNPVHTYAQGGLYNVKLVVTDGSGKKDSIVNAVNVKAKPLTAFDAPSVCEGTAVTVTNNTNTNGLSVSAWSWNFGDASTSSAKDPTPHPYLSLANYNVILKAVATNGCADSITKSVSIVSRPSAAITVAGTASFCQGKSVTLSTTKNPEYTYSWKLEDTEQTGGNSDTFIANTAGSYTVKITNPIGDCWSTSAPVNVVVKPSPLKPVFQAQNYTQGQCPGEHPVKLGVQNIQGYNYRWMMNGILLPKETSSSIEFYEPGNYRLIADLNGCTDTSLVFTAQFPQGPEKPVIYAEGPTAWYLATSVMNARYYKWYYNGNLVEGADKYYYMANRNEGIYQVSVGDANGCYTKSDSIFIGLPVISTGIDDPENTSSATIYPNPSDGLLFIELQNNYSGKIKVEVFSPEGKKVFTREFEKNDILFRESIDISGQAEGYYLINIYMNNKSFTKKVMIK